MKLKALFAVVFALVLAAPAGAEVPSGQLGVGYQGMFLDNIMNGASARYWLSDNLALEGDIFHLYAEATPSPVAGINHGHVLSFMGKALYAPVVKSNSRFYLGAQFGYAALLIPGGNNNGNLINAGPLMGAEYHFSEIPELGFNFEVGYLWNYAFQGVDPADLDIHLLGVNVAFGVHYYF